MNIQLFAKKLFLLFKKRISIKFPVHVLVNSPENLSEHFPPLLILLILIHGVSGQSELLLHLIIQSFTGGLKVKQMLVCLSRGKDHPS